MVPWWWKYMAKNMIFLIDCDVRGFNKSAEVDQWDNHNSYFDVSNWVEYGGTPLWEARKETFLPKSVSLQEANDAAIHINDKA